jgi:hypothetical protein
MEKYQIQLIPLAIKLLGKIKDKREQKLLTKKLNNLNKNLKNKVNLYQENSKIIGV